MMSAASKAMANYITNYMVNESALLMPVGRYRELRV